MKRKRFNIVLKVDDGPDMEEKILRSMLSAILYRDKVEIISVEAIFCEQESIGR